MNGLDFWSVLLSFGILQGVFLIVSILLKKISKTNILLIILLALTILSLINYLLFSSGLYFKVSKLIYLNHPLLFLIGPVYFFFIKSVLIKNFHWKSKDLFHLTPFFLAIAFHWNFYLRPNNEKIMLISNLLEAGRIKGNLLSHFYIFTHTIITLGYIYNVHRLIEFWNRKSSKKNKLMVWLDRFNKSFGIYWLSNLLVLTTLSLTIGLSVKTDYIVMLNTALLINILAFIALNYSQEFNKILIDMPNRRKYNKSSLSDKQLQEIILSVQTYMIKNKPYLNADLKISDISKSLSISTNNLSQALNQILGKKFFDFINEYRYKEMSSKLVDPSNEHETIYGMALESGFKNKNTAYKVFKKFSSMTPLEFIEAHKR